MNDDVNRFEELWRDFLEGELTDEALAELRNLLDTNPGLSDCAVDDYQMHRVLGLFHQRSEQESQTFVKKTMERLPLSSERFVDQVRAGLPASRRQAMAAKRRWIGHAVAASFAVIMTLAVQMAWPSREDVVPVVAEWPAAHVATLIRSDNCQWQSDSLRPLAEGSRMLPGEFRLIEGVALIRFDGGARMLVRAPSVFSIDSADSTRLQTGQVVVHATEMAAGFVLHTPQSDFVDWGTEFSVSVNETGETELHVYEGLVEWQASQDPHRASQMVTEGKSLHFGAQKPFTPQPITHAGQRFEASLATMNLSRKAGKASVYEGFDYRSTADILVGGGWGWNGRWFQGGFGSPDSIGIPGDESLPAPAALTSSLGGMLELPTGSVYVYKRLLSEPVNMSADAVHYVSVLIRRLPVANADQTTSLRLMLASRERQHQNIHFGIQSEGHPFVYARGSGHVMADTVIQDGKTYLLVGKVVSARHAYDQIFLKVFRTDEAIDLREPEDWTIASRPTDLADQLDTFNIGFGESGGFQVDEIRIGTTWEAVTPLLSDGA